MLFRSKDDSTSALNLISTISVLAVTVFSCYAYYRAHWHNHHGDQGELNRFNWLPQLMGWSSAVLYVGSRVPQILKNWRNKSTEGLSFGMFLCAVMGNVFFTSVSHILFFQTQRNIHQTLFATATLVYLSKIHPTRLYHCQSFLDCRKLWYSLV